MNYFDETTQNNSDSLSAKTREKENKIKYRAHETKKQTHFALLLLIKTKNNDLGGQTHFPFN